MMAGLAPLAAQTKADGFRFVHFTDTHIQPELGAGEGCTACFDAIRESGVDFAVAGGDLVMDAAEQGRARAKLQFDMYAEAVRRIEVPVRSVPGNHDVFGTSAKSGVKREDPQFGKKMFADRIGPVYSSFDHKGVHFVLLDSIGIGADGSFRGVVDAGQLEWLRSDLERVGKRRPVIAVTHVPLVSAAMQIVPDPWKTAETYLVSNSRAVLDVFAGYNLRAVLQGHTHIRENVTYDGCQFITSGAVCGNWWKGSRLGHPEGFAVVTVSGEGDVRWEYRTYGFKARV